MALANQKEVEGLADRLTGCADAIHDRLKRAIQNKEIEQYNAQAVFQEEAILRQRANSLYLDAANCVVVGVSESQNSLTGLIDSAKEKIKTMKKIASFIDLVADILVLAAAASAAKPAPILAALDEIKDDVEAFD